MHFNLKVATCVLTALLCVPIAKAETVTYDSNTDSQNTVLSKSFQLETPTHFQRTINIQLDNSKVFQKSGVADYKKYQFESTLDLTKFSFPDVTNHQLFKSKVGEVLACCGYFPPCFCCSC
jgi:hypothetical protein